MPLLLQNLLRFEFTRHGGRVHAFQVMDYMMDACAEFGIRNPEHLLDIRLGALLHDIGKMKIDPRIWSSPNKLSPREEAIMRRHPDFGAEILQQFIGGDAWIIAQHHHERWDGSGYPAGLKGTQIPLAARIFAPIDVFDALVMPRAYRDRVYSASAAWEEIVLPGSGTQFDPDAVSVLGRVLRARNELQARTGRRPRRS